MQLPKTVIDFWNQFGSQQRVIYNVFKILVPVDVVALVTNVRKKTGPIYYVIGTTL